MIVVPAIEVGDHAQGGVGDFRFSGQASFAVIGHANHVAPPLPVELTFGARREGRTFHAEIGAATVQMVTSGHRR